MESQDADRPIRRKPLTRRLAQDMRALLPAVAVGACFGVATMGIVAVEAGPTASPESRLAGAHSPPPVGAGRSEITVASVIEALGLPVPTPPAIVAGDASQEGGTRVESPGETESLSDSATSRSRAARPRR